MPQIDTSPGDGEWRNRKEKSSRSGRLTYKLSSFLYGREDEDQEERLVYTEDTKIPNAGTILVSIE